MKIKISIQTTEICGVVGHQGVIPLGNSPEHIGIFPSLHPQINQIVRLVASLLRRLHKGRMEAFVNQEDHLALIAPIPGSAWTLEVSEPETF